eukprot:SAG31_NODE_608_length_13576_cov_23.757290_6_plen_147_part_00
MLRYFEILPFECQVYLVANAGPLQCDHIITKATPSMANSGVSHVDSDIGKPATNWRTSTQARLPNRADSVVTGIERRVHGLMRVPEDQGEPLQVLRYLAGQKYDAHNDFFDPDLCELVSHVCKRIDMYYSADLDDAPKSFLSDTHR